MPNVRLGVLVCLSVVFALLLSGAALAQEGAGEPFCGQLGDEDCALLRGAAEAARGVNAGSFTAQMLVNVADTLEADSQQTTIAATVEGTYAIDRELITDTAPADAAAVTQARLNALRALSADLDVMVLIPTTGEAEGDMQVTQSVAFDVQLAGGTAYINIGTIDPPFILPTEGNEMPGWTGTDLVMLLNAAGQPGMSDYGPAINTALDTILTAREALIRAELSDFVSVERLELVPEDVQELIGQDAAVFATTFDVGALYADAEMQAMLRDGVVAQNEMMQMGMTDVQIDERLGMQAAALEGADVRIVEYIGVDDNMLHRLEVLVNNMVVTRANAENAAWVDLMMVIEYDNFNEVDAIEIDEDAGMAAANDVVALLGLNTVQPLGFGAPRFDDDADEDTDATAEADMDATAEAGMTTMSDATAEAEMTVMPEATEEAGS